MIQETTTIVPAPISKTNEPIIEIKELYKSFGSNAVLKGVTFSVNKSENLVVLGKSGSGKSISIKCIVGLITADEGEINVFGTDITKLDNNELNKIRVRIGFLFQNAALYDSMSVRENLGFTFPRSKSNYSTASTT